jgi:hypothetical protein
MVLKKYGEIGIVFSKMTRIKWAGSEMALPFLFHKGRLKNYLLLIVFVKVNY